MCKEIIICIVIIVAVCVGNMITQNYTKQSVEELSKELSELKQELLQLQSTEENNYKAKDKANIIKKNWESKHNKLAYFIEHNELEKVENYLIGMVSFIETKEYSDAINELDKMVFTLNHIQEKYAFSLENVF